MELDKGKVSVNIVNWNGLKYIKECLEAVSAQKYNGQIEVIVVDNGSIDGSRELVEQNYPWVRLVKNDSNLGFCRAHNQAIGLSKSEYVLPLNFDVLLEPDFIAEMVKAAEQDSKIGLVSGKLYKCFEGKATRLLDSTGIIMPLYCPAPRGEMELDEGQFDSAEHQYIFGPCGAAPLYRRAMLEDIKINGEYFDEDFVNYVEDVDLAWRAQLMGWKAVYTPHAMTYHERGATRREDQNVNRDYYLTGMRNRYLTIFKNIFPQELRAHAVKMLLMETALLFVYRKQGAISPRKRLVALFRARKGIRLMLRKRRIIQERVRVSPQYMGQFFGYENNTFFRMLTDYLVSFLYSGILHLKAGFIIRAGKKLVSRLGGRTSEERRLG